MRLKNKINCWVNCFVSESHMGWFGNRRRAFLVTSRAMASSLKNIFIDIMHEDSVRTSQGTEGLLRRDQNLVLSTKHTSTLWGQHVTSLGGIYSYHLAVSATHFVRFHPKSTYKLIVLNCLLATCDTVARCSECIAYPLPQSHPANIVMFNPLPSPQRPPEGTWYSP